MTPTIQPRSAARGTAPTVRRVRGAHRAAVFAAGIAAALLAPGAAAGQIPDTFTNLKHFPEAIPRDSLIGIMRQFSFALGVPCRYCHAGGPADVPWSLEDVDFASDEKIEKRRARYMLRMVDRINTELLAGLPERDGADAADRIRLECRTCHRGLARPEMIDRIVARKIEEEDIAAATAHYRELRERHYGDWQYDFGEWVMIDLARELAARDRPTDGIGILEMMTGYYPESTSVWLGLGDLQRLAGRREAAVASYRRVLELAPDHAGARQRLRELGQPGSRGPS